ncbi:unnamed protein product [Strongylus vulgaris]|uniref:G-protein coupled receptors family 1 profile domain-containing protein n=1 Tax=Strongylus vulgaris TaxID=40348 RepID=A0A3P7L9R3_STRVU|nr:unnamed protein product [Strongylus vulgaris]
MHDHIMFRIKDLIVWKRFYVFQATARAATRTLVMVVLCYLISNIISVVLTIWEHLDRDMLMEYVNFYAIAIDLVSLLTTSACACRLPIYLTCQTSLRQEIKEVLTSMCCCRNGTVEDSEYLVYKLPSGALINGRELETRSALQSTVLASADNVKICISSAYETLL